MALALTLPATGQSPLCTLVPFASNNGLSATTGIMVLFDLNVTTAVLISSFDCNLMASAGTAASLEVYTTPGSYVGNELNPAPWTLAATDVGGAVAAGRDQVLVTVSKLPAFATIKLTV